MPRDRDHKQAPLDRWGPDHKGDLTTKKAGAGSFGWGQWSDDIKYMDEIISPDDEANPDNVVFVRPSTATQARFVASAADLARFKNQIKSALREYLANPDVEAFESTVRNLDATLYHQDLPKIIVQFGLDLSAPERTRLNTLMLHLYNSEILRSSHLKAGLTKVFNNLDDILVDAPNARDMIREFTDFAISNNLLDSKVVMELEEEVELLSNATVVTAAKTSISDICRDFLNGTGSDVEVAMESVNELKLPQLGFEVVKRFILTAFDRDARCCELVSQFLAAAVGSCISQDQLIKGFTILLQRTEDIFLDTPNVLGLLAFFIARAVIDEVLPPAFLLRVDLQQSDMGFRVVEHAQALLSQRGAAEKLSEGWTE